MTCALKRFQDSWRALFSSVTELDGCERAEIYLPSIYLSPRHALDIVRFKEVINKHRSVTWCLIIHGYDVQTDSNPKEANIRLKSVVSVSLSSHIPRVKEMEVCAAAHHDACPLHPLRENDILPLCFLVQNVFHVLFISLPAENHY
ncbi:hypothetical protein TNCV_4729291 [Trichonephila clavipes]|nr:hypothetical protein TNCV_4729291 [Trichonephila clavipes]